MRGLPPPPKWKPPNRKLTVLVCGDRNWKDYAILRRTLTAIHSSDEIIKCVLEGECRGADLMARKWALERSIRLKPFPADWDNHHKAAGPIRNRRMFKEGKPDLTVAFHDNIYESRGTKDMYDVAEKGGCPVLLVSHNDISMAYKGHVDKWASSRGTYIEDYICSTVFNRL